MNDELTGWLYHLFWIIMVNTKAMNYLLGTYDNILHLLYQIWILILHWSDDKNTNLWQSNYLYQTIHT